MKQSLLKLRLFIVSLCLCSGLPALHATAEANDPGREGYHLELEEDTFIAYSDSQIVAIQKLAEANPGSTDLRNFVDNKLFMEDRPYSKEYNVGVVWNNENPREVQQLFIRDNDKTVSTLDLSAFTSLEHLYLNGTNVSSLDMSQNKKLYSLELWQTQILQWTDLILPHNDVIISGASIIPYPKPDISGGLDATIRVGTTVDLSQWANAFDTDTEFAWIRNNRDTVYFDNNGTPGMFDFSAYTKDTYQCIMTNASRPGLELKTSIIRMQAEEPVKEMELISSVPDLDFGRYSTYDNEGFYHTSFGIANCNTIPYVYIQITGGITPSVTLFNKVTREYEQVGLDDQMGVWYPVNFGYHEEGNDNANVNIEFETSSTGSFTYEVRVYASQDLSSTPLLSSGTKQVNVIDSNSFPQLKTSSVSIRGDKNKDHTFTCQLQVGNEFSQVAGRLEFYLTGADAEGISISGDGLINENGSGWYYWDIPSIGNGTYTFTINSSVDYNSNFQLNLYRIEGNNSYYLACTSTFSIQIPPSFSQSDQDALKALATANPLSNDLYNFIQQGIYLKDTEHYGSSQNVGVKWNSESPARVEMFFINDYQSRAVTSLNLKPLTSLKEVYIDGTNLSTLDLSGLTLRQLELWGTKLKWGDVQLPNWDTYYHISGNSWIQIGTPLNDYNSVAASGTEIDLSEYASFAGEASTFTWYKVLDDDKSEKVTLESTATGKFILIGKPGEKFYGEIAHPQYGNWTMRTSTVQIQRSASDFNAADIAGLQKLAADNPDVPVLQEFVDSKGWEIENWNNWEDEVRTQWDTNNRLTHLCIELNWEQDPDTISTLDLSAFTELKYFECDRWLNIKELNLANNTKLEHLHIFSNNIQSIDASMCTNLQVFKFATEDMREGEYAYNECNLTSLNLPSSLKLLRIEHAHIGSFDFGQFPNLVSLHIGNCQALQPLNLNKLTKLERAELPMTTQFGDWIKTLPATVTALWIQNTDYAMPDATLLGRLKQFGVPNGITQLDLSTMPNLEVIGWEGNDIRYSTVQNWNRNLRVNVVYQTSLGGSTWWSIDSNIQLQSPSHPNSSLFENGDTIDLSSEAVINGVKSTFLWVNTKYNIEETEALQEVPGKPGVFVLNSKEEKYGSYRCIIMNEQFCDITPINESRGWRMETNWFQVNTEVPVTYHEGDVQALSQIVKNSDNQQLLNWWNEDCWQTGEYKYSARTEWNEENPRRLIGLEINTSVGESADLSAFDKLVWVRISPFYEGMKQVTLPTETQNLQSLTLSGNRALQSLIVAPYSNLQYLNVTHCGLTACDVSQNGKLTELFMRYTKIPDVEETAPEIAKQLIRYGASDVTESIDLNNFPNLKQFYPHSSMRYSDVKNPRQMDPLDMLVETDYYCGNGVYHPEFTPIGQTFDLTNVMAEDGVTSVPVWDLVKYETDTNINLDNTNTWWTLDEQQVEPENLVVVTVYNDYYPNWQLRYNTWAYTTDGDVNLDRTVNIQDVTGMVSWMLDSWPDENLFGWAQSNTNYNDSYGEVADLVGIVNIILERPITKASALRAGEYVPSVALEVDEKNFLTMENETPVAGLYLEFTGATEQLPLLGDAARLSQASSLHGDTLRIVAYSIDGKSIASGKHILMQMQPGMKLIKANFSDQQAVTLRNSGNGAPTANETVRPSVEAKAISNYPNPTSGQTTFTYTLEEDAQQAEIQLFAANGALATRLQGLPATCGTHSYTAHLSLPIGVYYYRLLINGKQATATNILIIK